MKKTLSVFLAILMLIPAFACFAFAGEEEEVAPLSDSSYVGTNIASQAEIVFESAITGKINPAMMVDGNQSTGTKTNREPTYSFKFVYDQPYYFTDIVLYVNGSGTLPDGKANESNSLDEVTLKLYKAGEEVLSEKRTTSGLEEVAFDVEMPADTIEIYRDQQLLSTSARGNDFYREVEFYMIEKEICDVVKSNIASEAFIYAAGTNEDDYCDSWWAWNPKALVDGDPNVGTHSPKGWNYSVFVEFTKDYLISELNLTLNGKGVLVGNSQKLEEAKMNVSQIRVRLYNLEGEQVYDSKDIGVDSTEVKVDPFVEACKIKIEIANGKGDGSEYLWEIETFVEEGNHIFEEKETSNPTCNRPGYIEYECHCGKLIKKVVPATGFHQWDDGIVTTPPTETENGVLTKSCYACGETKNFDIPATAHNWDEGVKHLPDCENDGYTIYTCQGCSVSADCEATYKTEMVEKFGHDWDNGVVTKEASVTKFGEKLFTCMRDGCGATQTKQTRKLQYTDSVADFEFTDSNHTANVVYNTTDIYNGKESVTKYNAESRYYELQDPKNLLDGDVETYWHGTNGSTYEIIFDREYIFTQGTLHASGNSVFLMIEWIDANDEVTATYVPKWNTIDNGADNTSPLPVTLNDSLVGGVKAKRILITITGAKWENGAALTLHDFDFVAHKCQVSEKDYTLSGSGYKAPTCLEDGYCNATCPVCFNVEQVILDNEIYGHSVPQSSVITDVDATCSSVGYGHGTCTSCNQTINNIEIPALGKHEYNKEIVYMAAKCGSVGIKQFVCAGCGRVGSQSAIPATNEHDHKWAEDYCSTYTAEGQEKYVCKDCGLPSTDENGVANKVIEKKVLSKEFLTFIGYSIRTTDFAGIRLTYKIDMEMLAELEYECDVRVITEVTNSDGVTKSVESYGKYSKDIYSKDGQFSVVINPSSYYEEYEINTKVRLMNFRGVEYVEFDLGELSTDSNGKISLCEVAEYVLASGAELGPNEKKFYEEIVAEK